VLLFGLAGLAVGFVYTGPPLRLANRGLGELAVALAFGVGIVCGTAYVQAATCRSRRWPRRCR
jgi:1,4-dihydroxy-2-naphthoate octaprenyltransferase